MKGPGRIGFQKMYRILAGEREGLAGSAPRNDKMAAYQLATVRPPFGGNGGQGKIFFLGRKDQVPKALGDLDTMEGGNRDKAVFRRGVLNSHSISPFVIPSSRTKGL